MVWRCTFRYSAAWKLVMVPLAWLGTTLWAMQGRVIPRRAGVSQATEDAVLHKVAMRVFPLHLRPGPTECLLFWLQGATPKDYEVQIRENHDSPACHGDPETSLRVADVRVSRKTGAMTWNYYLFNHPERTYTPVPRSKRSADQEQRRAFAE